MSDRANWFFGFIIGVLVTSMGLGVACDPPPTYIKAHTRAAMGCTVIPQEEAAPGVEGLDKSAVYWRCKDGKVYVR